MADVTVTNTFTAGQKAVAAEVNTNFTDLVDYINNTVARATDSAGPAFTYVPTGPATDPSADNHLTRKLYVDRRVGHTVGATSTGGDTATFGAFDAFVAAHTLNLTVPDGKFLTVLAFGSFIGLGHSAAAQYYGRVDISFDGGSTYDAGAQVWSGESFTTNPVGLSAFHIKAGVSSGTTIKLRLRGAQDTTFSGFGHLTEPTLAGIAIPTVGLTL